MKPWKFLNRRNKIALLTIALSGSFFGTYSADAAVLVATIPSDYINSEMGTITGSRVTTHVDKDPHKGVVKGLNRDPGLYGGTTINGKSMLLLRQYTYSTTDLKPIQILDMEGDPNKPVVSGVIKSAANPHSGVSNGKYVFMADYDLGTVGAARIDGDKLVEETEMVITADRFLSDLRKGWESGTAPYAYGDDVTVHGEGLYIDHNHLFVAYNINPKDKGWMEYKDGVLAEYEILGNGKLKFKGAARIGKNVDSVRINKYNDHYIMNGIGGMQHYGGERNPESGIFMVSAHAGEGLTKPAENSRQAVVPQNVIQELDNHFSDFYNCKITPDGQAYILAYGLNAGKVNQFQVYKTTVSNLYSSNPVSWEKIIDTSPDNGWFGRIDYDFYTKRLWAEIGSELKVYTDGDKNPTHTWEARSFSTNEHHYTFNSVAVISGDKVTGELAGVRWTAPSGIAVYNNPEIKTSLSKKIYKTAVTGTAKDTAYKKLTADNKNYKFNEDVDINRDIGFGDLRTNAYAGVFAREGNDIVIDTVGHVLEMHLSNDIGSPVGIFAGNGKNVTIRTDGLNISTSVNAEYGNSISHGIWNDAGKDQGSTIDITGPVQIYMGGGYGGYGVAVQKLDRWGEKSNEANTKSQINIHGDLSIRSGTAGAWGIGVNRDNVYSRFNSAGILTTVDNSEVNIDGDVDFRIYGNGITANAAGSRVSIGGGRIEVPSGKKYGYYAIGAYQGTVNVNTGKNGDAPGNNTVQLAGDIFALPTGTVNLGLTNSDSYIEGIIDNGGTANLLLRNRAVWHNLQQNKRYEKDNEDIGAGEKSRVTKLTGGSDAAHGGIIFQKGNTPILVDNYGGHTTVIYEHDTSVPGDPNTGLAIKGGDFRIKKAAAGSGITLRTDNAGLNTVSTKAADKNLVSGTLNKLANKLYYEAYKNGEKNLAGKVEIAEGLTARSASQRIEDITYKDTDGQGQYLYTPAKDEKKTGPITTSEDINVTRKAEADGSIRIVWTEPNAVNGKYVSTLYSENSTSKQNPMVVDLNGHNLNLKANSAGKIAAAVYVGNNQYININGGVNDKLLIEATNTDTRGSNGIFLEGNSHLNIKGNVEISNVVTKGDAAAGIAFQGKDSEAVIDGTLKITDVYGKRGKGVGINATGIAVTGENSKMTVTGPVFISGVKGSGLKTVGADTMISVGGGTIEAAEDADKSHNYYAARVEKGTININMDGNQAGKKKTNITGDMFVTGQYGKKVIEYSGGQLVDWKNAGKLNVALTDDKSSWKGAVVYDQYTSDYGTGGKTVHDVGEFNLWLQNGAVWTNERQSHGTTTTTGSAAFIGSQIAHFHGDNGDAKKSVVYQKDENPIFVNTYSGKSTIIYEHDTTAPADPNEGFAIKGGDFKITNAAAGSDIVLRTDNAGLYTASDKAADKNLVSGTLNKLANKLYYAAYTKGEKNLSGKVEIAEGLTAQSVSMKVGDITYKDADGQGQYLYTPVIDIPNHQTVTEFSTTLDGIEATDMEYTEGGVRKIVDGKVLYDFTENSTITVDDGDYAGNDAFSNPAILGSKNTTININVAGGKVLKLVAETAGSHWADGITALDGSKTTINGDVEIHAAESGNGSGTGIRMTPAGTSQGAKTDVIINGNLKIRKDDPNAPWAIGNGVYASYGARYQATGLFNNQSRDSLLKVSGNVDLAVKGTAVAVDDYYDGDAVIDLAGGRIETPDDREKKENTYLSLASYSGTINLNYDAEKQSSRGRKVELIGNTLVIDSKNHQQYNWLDGKMNLALDTSDSYWNGAATNAGADKLGVFNLVLKNGAVWDNQLWAKAWDVKDPYTGGKFDGISHVTKFSGGDSGETAGVIKMRPGVGLSVEEYAGNTIVIYEHDTAEPADPNEGLAVKGGDFKIAKAAADSGIVLRTDNTGLNTSSTKAADRNLVSGTLNKLANKLYYTAYKDGEKNLTGKVEIAEGLTASTAGLRIEDITYKETDGQGFYSYTPASDTLTEFGRAITGGTDQLYVDAGVKQADGIYKFTKDSTITIDDTVLGETYPINTDGGDKVIVNAEGKKLTLISKGNALRAGIQTVLKNNKKIDITADKLIINAENTKGMSRAYGIWFAGNSSTLDIHGDTEITSKANDWSYGVLLGQASKANFDGLKVSVSKEAKESAALKGTGKSVISVNVQGDTAGSRSVQLDGEVVTKYLYEEDEDGIVTTNGPSTINLALTTADSYWNGLSAYSYKDENGGDTIAKEDHGNLNLWLQNGAVWTNEKYGKTEYAGFKGSYVTRLTGGSDMSHAGVIIQKDEKPISVENYSGHTTVIYEHDTAAPADPNEGFAMKGGDFKIAKAAANSGITLRTDNEGLDTASIKAADKNLVSGTLNKLANKLHYEAYTKGEKNLTGKVEIAEGLTAQSASMRMEDITYRDADGRGQYLYTPAVDIPEEQDVTEFSTAITGDETADTFYVNHGVLKNGLYSFTKSESTITTDGASIPGGPWMGSIMAAISGSSKEKSATLDLNGNKLTVDTGYNATVGIAGIGSGKVEINNAGAMSVNGERAALYANGGGMITIHNGHDSAGTLTLRAGSSNPRNVAVVKTMNGADGVTSSITIDGLVDILADAKAEDGHGANEAVSAVASDINIGGGTIKAINGAWAAIRAYGEFVSQNYGTVNVNVTKGEDGLANGAGSLKTVIEGDIVTNGGMGTKGRVSVGLSTADSHWIGNYGDTRGYGVTQGQLGAVNLFMKNGSYWKGFSNGSIKVEMDGKDTNWVGFNVGDGMQLSMKNGATWYNAITKDQKDQSGKSVDSKVTYFTSNKGIVDMTGAKAFIASANSLSGPTSGQSTFVTERPDSETGNLVIGNYSGNATVIYKHEIKDDSTRENAALYGNKAANIIGGTLTVAKAAENSSITLRTDNE